MTSERLDYYDISHNVFDFINKQNLLDLETLFFIISQVSKNPEGMYNYYTALIDKAGLDHYNDCPVCRTSHEKGDRDAYDKLTSKLETLTKDKSMLELYKNLMGDGEEEKATNLSPGHGQYI